jgi:hypothetical protein
LIQYPGELVLPDQGITSIPELPLYPDGLLCQINLSLMGDGIKVVLTFIPEETLNILGFIPELLSIHGIKVETWFDRTATRALGVVNSRALNALSPVINLVGCRELCNEMCRGVGVR